MMFFKNDLNWWFKLRTNLFLLNLILFSCLNQSNATFYGGFINDFKHLSIVESPYFIKENILIAKNAELKIDPGVILYFYPRKGMTIHGKLTAKGTADDKILFTIAPNSNTISSIHPHSSNNNNFDFSNNIQPLISSFVSWPSVRLVDGLKPTEGRLQIYYRNKWQSVCTNSKNWTEIDTTVVCRQLGYNKGTWYQWFDKNNESNQFMLESPKCIGNELTINDCLNWNKKAIGSGICDYHQDIGIRCDEEFYYSPNFWSGLKFINAESENILIKNFDDKISRLVSKSIVENIVVEYAGESEERKSTPAILSIGVSPKINRVTVKWSASTALNLTNPMDSVSIENSYFIENRGYGVFVNTSWGSVELNNVKIERNGADGLKYVLQKDDLIGYDFCQFTKHGVTQIYPIRLTHEQIERSLSGRQCCQVFELPKILEDARLTVHFSSIMNDNVFINEEEEKLSQDGFIEVFDGYKQEKKVNFPVQNKTQPFSFTSSTDHLQVCYTPSKFKKTFFTMVVVAGHGKAFDLNVTRSEINSNNGRGIWLENSRSGLVVNHTIISNNTHIAGIQASNGLGDLILNNTIVKNNIGDGLNISLSNGDRHIDRSVISGNTKRGIAFHFNETNDSLYTSLHQFKYQVTFSEISNNLEEGLLIGNICSTDAFWNISMNQFSFNFGNAFHFKSCWKTDSKSKQALLITHNKFTDNQRLAMHFAPLLHIRDLLIKNNLFQFNRKGVIYINNYDYICNNVNYNRINVKVKIKDNHFLNNLGYFVVNLGLNENSKSQSILFTNNWLKNNVVGEPYTKLNPRSRVSAVVTVSSSNVKIYRNNLMNKESNYEIGVHLEHYSKQINATYNYFGDLSKQKETLEIYKRLFDRKNRYNLAYIDYLPYRTDEYDFETTEFISSEQEKDKRINFYDGNKIIGGEIRGIYNLPSGIYSVKNDIYISPNSVLSLRENTILEFDYSIGMMVQGEIDIKASKNNPIIFRGNTNFLSSTSLSSIKNFLEVKNEVSDISLKQTEKISQNQNFTVSENFNFQNSTKIEIKDSFLKNEMNLNNLNNSGKILNNNINLNEKLDTTNQEKFTNSLNYVKNRSKRDDLDRITNVRLSNSTEGRLEVQINGQWGSVCSYKFDIIDAAIVCQQLGLVLNSEDWLLSKNQFVNSENLSYVILSNLDCDKFDWDLSLCKAEKKIEDFENSCFSEIGIKCKQASWSGIRFGMSAKPKTIENIVVENSGLLDYSTNKFKPALQIDFNQFKFKNLKIINNRDSGIGIMWNNIFDNENLEITDSEISYNEKHGIMTASQGFQIKNCLLSSNKGNGVFYQPMFNSYIQNDIVSWLSPNEFRNLITLPKQLSTFAKDGSLPNIHIRPHQSWFIQIEKSDKQTNFSFQVETQIGYSIGLIVINPINLDFTDDLTLKYRDKIWNLRKNLTSFTMNHFVFKFTLNYFSGFNPLGDIILFFYSKPIIVSQSKSLIELQEENNFKIKTISLENNKIISNLNGFSSRHYNLDYNSENDQFYHRYDNETFYFNQNTFSNNFKNAIYVESSVYQSSISSLSEINYTLIKNQFFDNQKAISLVSNNIENSNNLFHWNINDSLIENTLKGGIDLELPYCWQYNENYTHTINIHHNNFLRNQNFELILGGHFAKLNFSQNRFVENHCKFGLVTITGMEKEMNILNNRIENNFGDYMFEFNIQSHADKFGTINAKFEHNYVLNNRNYFLTKPLTSLKPFNYAVSIKGVQYINITKNLINNPDLNYEFLVGVLTGNLHNKLNLKENWWGTHNVTQIEERIFDFDDWNSYAVADYSPYLALESFDSISIKNDDFTSYNKIDFNKPLGGRLSKNLTLFKKKYPYIVKSDLTIMPGSTLKIEAGVVLEFYPSVGILALGNLIAVGDYNDPIIMKALQKDQDIDSYSEKEIISEKHKNYLSNPEINNVRLCKSIYCEEWVLDSDKKDGFLEIYNHTTLQWVPVCDKTFTKRNAEVICHQMGFSTLNVHLKFGKRLDMDNTLITRVQDWPQSLECNGKENKIKECFVRSNENKNYINNCEQQGNNFVYIYCGGEFKKNLNNYWGGIRFALSDFENRNRENFYLPARNNYNSESRLHFVNLTNAGILHGEKNAAIQIIQRDVNLGFVSINESAYHGLEIISPSGHLLFDHLSIFNNLGSGLNYLLLDGAANKNLNLPYKPTKVSTLPYHVFSLVDMCDINKNLIVDQRVLIYYKYNSRPVDCVKIFKSSRASEKVSFRLLQFNLFNSTKISNRTDFIQIYDGDIFNYTSKLIADLGVEEHHRINSPQDHFYQSSLETMSVRLHASGAREEYGFIAEIVTSTSSHYFGGALFNNVTFSYIGNNVQGALTYRSIGETTPIVSLMHNSIQSNCLKMFGNFTTCKSAIDIEVQNSPFVLIDSNFIKDNIGGLLLSTNAHYLGTALKGSLISNNLFVNNLYKSVLHIKALVENDFFQLVNIYRNYFTRNISPYKTNIIISQLLCNFTQNIIVKNQGLHQLEVLGFDRNSHLYQEIRGNWFYNNLATMINTRSTVIANSAGQHYLQNYFVNPDNDFEMSSVNRSSLKEENYFIDAKENWWGDSSEITVRGRIKNYLDNPGYIEVKYHNFLSKNSSVLSGICAGGWQKIGDTCLIYIPSRMSFSEAQRFCEQENSTMPFVSTNHLELTNYLYQMNENYDKRFYPVWVQSFQYSIEECTALLNEKIETRSCLEKLSFFCEKDPLIRVAAVYDNWYKDSLLISVLIISTIIAFFALLCIVCWLCKSKARYKEKLHRRNSIRASIRSNKSYSLSTNSLNEHAYKKQIEKALQQAREQQHQRQKLNQQNLQNNFLSQNYSTSTLNDFTNSINDRLIHMPNYTTTILGHHSSSTFKMNNHAGSYESFDIAASNNLNNTNVLSHHLKMNPNHNSAFVNDSSFDDTSTHNYNTLRPSELEDRFINDPQLENANVELLVKPTFDLTYENAGFKETPSLSRNSEYADAIEWNSVNNNLANEKNNQYPMGQFIKRKNSSNNHLNQQSFGKKFNKPLPPVAKYRQHQLQINQNINNQPKVISQKPTSNDYDSRIDQFNSQIKNLNNDLYSYQCRSQSTLLGGSDITSMSQDGKYLETSLDNDSIADNNFDYYENQSNQYSPNTSITTAATNKSLPPMETAM